MTNSTSYKIGKWFGEQPTVGKIFLIALISLALYHSCSVDTEQAVTQTKQNTAEKEALSKNAKKLCEETIQIKKQEYSDLKDKKQYWAAANQIRSCARRLENDELRNLVKEAEIASHLSEINNLKLPPRTRAQAMQKLARDYPEVGAKFAKQAEQLIVEADKIEREAERKRKKSEGVRIGMTQEDILASSWGKPTKVNRSTYSFGVHEQWVYRGGNYLYLEDGILTSIQN